MSQNGSDKYLQCPMCWKEFSKQHTLKIHMRVHTGEKPFQCQYCPKSFTTSGNLTDHLHVHSTARMYKCNLCGAKFKRNATMKRHYEMHAKHKKDKDEQENVDSIVLSGSSEEVLQTEIVSQPIYISRYDRETEIVVAEQSEEMVQTEIIDDPSHINIGDLQDQRCSTVQLLFPPACERGDQECPMINPVVVKEERPDDLYDAILELTEEMEDLDGVKLKVYRLRRDSGQVDKLPFEQDEIVSTLHEFPPLISGRDHRSGDDMTDNKERRLEKQLDDSHPHQLDLSRRYGAYITKMLKLIQPKEKQAELIKELNQSIHEFVVENR